ELLVPGRARVVVLDDDLLLRRDVPQLLQRLLVRAAPGVALAGVVLVVERHARADDVEHGEAPEAERRLEELAHLLGVAGERARDEPRAGDDRLDADVDRREVVAAG